MKEFQVLATQAEGLGTPSPAVPLAQLPPIGPFVDPELLIHRTQPKTNIPPHVYAGPSPYIVVAFVKRKKRVAQKS